MGWGLWCVGRRAGLLLVLVCLSVYLPGLFAIPPIDRDEARFAQASRQMFESVALPAAQRDPAMHSGGLVVPMVQGRARLNKPPLIYWLQSASAFVFTAGDPLKDGIWMYRVPGVLCAIATVLMSWRLGVAMFDRRAALLGAVLLGVCPLVVIDAHQARADQLLLMTVVGAQWALWTVWGGARAGGREGVRSRFAVLAPFAFWFFVGLSILAKGPVGPMIVALTCAGLSWGGRDWRWLARLRPLAGLAIVVVIVGPWLYAVGQRVGWSEFLSIAYRESVGRGIEAREGHWGPPGYHAVLLAVLFWPGSLTTLAGLGRAVARGFPRRSSGHGGPAGGRGSADSARSRLGWLLDRRPGRSSEFFCLAWIVPAWLVFEVIGTKLPHYTMPMYPAIALLSARAIILPPSRAGRLMAMGPWLAIGAALCIAMPAAPWFIGVRPSPLIIPLGLVWLLAVTGAAAVVWWRLRAARGGGLAIQGAGVVAIAGTFAFLMQGLLPQTKRLWPSARIMELLAPLDPAGSRPLAAAGYVEDSLVFLTRGRVARLDETELDGWLASHPDGLAVVPASPPADPAARRVVADLWGYNYTTGTRVDLVIVEAVR